MLRLAQCDYNAGHDADALRRFSPTSSSASRTRRSAREAQRGTELALYRLGQSPTARAMLASWSSSIPTSAFAADAQFQIARRAYQEKRYAEAAEGFRRVVSRSPATRRPTRRSS